MNTKIQSTRQRLAGSWRLALPVASGLLLVGAMTFAQQATPPPAAQAQATPPAALTAPAAPPGPGGAAPDGGPGFGPRGRRGLMGGRRGGGGGLGGPGGANAGPGRGMRGAMESDALGQIEVRLLLSPQAKRALMLTDDQAKKIDDANYESQKQVIENEAKLRLANLDLQRLMGQDKLDKDQILKQIDEVGKYQIEQRKLEVGLRLAVRELLTPDQLQRLPQLRERGAAARGARRGNGPANAGGPAATRGNGPNNAGPAAQGGGRGFGRGGRRGGPNGFGGGFGGNRRGGNGFGRGGGFNGAGFNGPQNAPQDASQGPGAGNGFGGPETIAMGPQGAGMNDPNGFGPGPDFGPDMGGQDGPHQGPGFGGPGPDFGPNNN